MKYILPLVISLFFTACNDSNQKAEASADTNITSQAQTVAPIQEEKVPAQAEKMPVQEEKAPVSVEKVPTKAEQAPVQTQKVPTQPIAVTNTTEVSGEAVFNKCKSCHGNSAEKKALGSSQIIKGWEIAKIEDALKGYQSGTYGGAMKNIMAAQAKGLSSEEIKKVATYIHTL